LELAIQVLLYLGFNILFNWFCSLLLLGDMHFIISVHYTVPMPTFI